MTSGEIIALSAVVTWVILVEFQILAIRKDLTRESIMRKCTNRIMERHIKGLWEDIRAAGIHRFRNEECDDD